jgi:YihY family inner membrane protein
MGVTDKPIKRVDAFQQRHGITAFGFAVAKKYGDDRGGMLAAVITYYGFVALFPLLLLFVTVVGFALHDKPGLQHDLLKSALSDFPIIGTQLRRNIHGLQGSGLALAIGLLGLLWGSLGVAQAAQHTMAEVWDVPERLRPGFGPRLARALLIVGLLALGTVATTVITGFTTATGQSVALRVVTLGLTLGANVVLYIAAFRVLTPKPVETRDLVLGAVVAGVLWTVLQTVGSYLIEHQLRHSSEVYGFFAIVLGLLAWLYLGAQVLVYSAEVSVVRARRLWPRSLVPPPVRDVSEM